MRRFFKNTDGNMTIMFGLSIFGILAASGAAIDYGRHMEAVTEMQSAVDAAALAVAKEKEAQRKNVAEKYFVENFASRDDLKLKTITVTNATGTVEVIAVADVNMSFMSLFGIKSLPAQARSVVNTSNKKVEIALVLDVSGSMNAGMGATSRINVLKSAATRLLDIVSKNGTDMDNVKIAVVPFNMNVNVGTANASFVKDTSNALFTGQAWAGCVLERAGTGATSDAYNANNGADGKWQAYVWPPEPNSNMTCINNGNGTNSGYAMLDAPSGFRVMLQGPNYNCVRHPVAPLTNTYDTIKSKIDGLTAEGNMGTIIGPGVSWGMRVLSPTAPFTEGANPAADVEKYMVVLTDGEQTTEAEYFGNKCGGAVNTSEAYAFDPATLGLAGKKLSSAPKDMFSAYGYILDSDPFNSSPQTWDDVREDLYNISTSACTQAKTASKKFPTRVFSIAVSNDAGPGTTTYDLLSNCASTKDDFYMASNDAALLKAFEDIANEIADIRLVQ